MLSYVIDRAEAGGGPGNQITPGYAPVLSNYNSYLEKS